MKKINMKTKRSSKTFDEGFEQFILEHLSDLDLENGYLQTGWIQYGNYNDFLFFCDFISAIFQF